MRLIVLDRSPHGNAADGRSDALLVRCAASHGAETRIVRFDGPDDPALAAIVPGDVVLARADLRTDQDLERVAGALWALEHRGVTCHPSAEGLVASEDKLRTFVRLRRAGIPTPSTVAFAVEAQAPEDVAALHERLQAFPLIVKRPVGWGGRDVMRCEDAAALRHVIENERAERPDGAVLIQPFVPHERSVTVLVVGGRALSAWAARPAPGEFRTNTRLGATVEDAALDPEHARLAVAAVEACALSFGSVDFLETSDGKALVLEVNSMPGLWPDDEDDRRFAEESLRHVLGGR